MAGKDGRNEMNGKMEGKDGKGRKGRERTDEHKGMNGLIMHNLLCQQFISSNLYRRDLTF